jgi:hypothetical protein
MRVIAISAICFAAITVAGCNNALKQPEPGQTPASINPNTPAYGAAGGPLVPANNPNSQLTPVPPGGTGQGYLGRTGEPLVAPDNPDARSSSGSTLEEQQRSGYFPNAQAPLTPPNPSVR